MIAPSINLQESDGKKITDIRRAQPPEDIPEDIKG
jgi:hypothetical protein